MQTSEDQLISAYLDAIGGYDALQALRKLHLIGEHREGDYQIQFDFFWKRPNIRRVNWRLDDTTWGAEGFDGLRSWEYKSRTGQLETLSGAKAAAARRGAEFDESLVGYRSKGHQVILVGEDSLRGRDVYHLQVTLADGWVKHYYLDAETWLITALQKAMPVHGEGDVVTSLTYYAEYRPVAGVLYPWAADEFNQANGKWMSSVRWSMIEANQPTDEENYQAPDIER